MNYLITPTAQRKYDKAPSQTLRLRILTVVLPFLSLGGSCFVSGLLFIEHPYVVAIPLGLLAMLVWGD